MPKKLWHRTLSSLRKEDAKIKRLDCEVCLCSKDTPPPAAASSDASKQPSAKEAASTSTDDGEKSDKEKCSTSPAAEAVCTCAEGWLCVDCNAQIGENAQSTIFDELEKAAEDGDLKSLHELTQHPLILWLLTLDCDDTDDAQHFAGLSQRLLRVPSYLENGVVPTWPRPAAKPRSYTSQVGYSALEAFNFVAGGKIR